MNEATATDTATTDTGIDTGTMNVTMAAPARPELDQIKDILEWIGFKDKEHQHRIFEDAFSDFYNVLKFVIWSLIQHLICI